MELKGIEVLQIAYNLVHGRAKMEEEKYKKFVNEFSDTLYAMTNGRCFSLSY